MSRNYKIEHRVKKAFGPAGFSILFLALGLRLGAALLLPQGLEFADSQDYDAISRALVEGRGFHGAFGDYQHVRPPLYPLLLAAGRLISTSPLFPRVIQAGLDTLSVAWLILLGTKLGMRRREALLAGLLYAMNPFAIFFSRLILSETLFTFLLLTTLNFWVSSRRWGPLRRGALLGASVGLLLLTRTVAMGLVPVFAFLEVFQRGRDPRRQLLTLVVMGVTCLAFQAPWILRNHGIYGRWMLGSPGGGITLYESLNPLADGGPQKATDKYPDLYPRGSLAELDQAHRDAALDWASENPRRALELVLEKQKRYWSPTPNVEEYRRWPYLLVQVYELPYLLAGFIGVLFVWWRGHPMRVLVPVLLFFPLLHTLYLGSIRYRMPIEPLLALFAANLAIRILPRRAGRIPG